MTWNLFWFLLLAQVEPNWAERLCSSCWCSPRCLVGSVVGLVFHISYLMMRRLVRQALCNDQICLCITYSAVQFQSSFHCTRGLLLELPFETLWLYLGFPGICHSPRILTNFSSSNPKDQNMVSPKFPILINLSPGSPRSKIKFINSNIDQFFISKKNFGMFIKKVIQSTLPLDQFNRSYYSISPSL